MLVFFLIIDARYYSRSSVRFTRRVPPPPLLTDWGGNLSSLKYLRISGRTDIEEKELKKYLANLNSLTKLEGGCPFISLKRIRFTWLHIRDLPDWVKFCGDIESFEAHDSLGSKTGLQPIVEDLARSNSSLKYLKVTSNKEVRKVY